MSSQTLKVIDPHVHFWDPATVSYPWLQNPGVAYSGDNRLLPSPYDPATLLAGAGGVDVMMTVDVEANPADALAEAKWLQSLANDPHGRGHPHGIVAYADLSRGDAPAQLERLARCRNLRGIRQILNVHALPAYNYVDRDLLQDPSWHRHVGLLAQYHWSFDLQLYPAQVSAALAVVDANPGVNFILNHAGMFVDRAQFRGWRQWHDALRALARRGNTAIKLSGLVMFDHGWSIESLRPYVLDAIDAFGPDRCMFASNFPIDGLHASYAQLWMAYSSIVADASASERDGLFVSNAARYYRLPTRN